MGGGAYHDERNSPIGSVLVLVLAFGFMIPYVWYRMAQTVGGSCCGCWSLTFMLEASQCIHHSVYHMYVGASACFFFFFFLA